MTTVSAETSTASGRDARAASTPAAFPPWKNASDIGVAVPMCRGSIPYRSWRSLPDVGEPVHHRLDRRDAGQPPAAAKALAGRPVAAVVAAVTSAPFVSCASTRDCCW